MFFCNFFKVNFRAMLVMIPKCLKPHFLHSEVVRVKREGPSKGCQLLRKFCSCHLFSHFILQYESVDNKLAFNFHELVCGILYLNICPILVCCPHPFFFF